MQTQNLKSSLDYLFKSAHTNEGWISPLLEAVDGVTLDAATYRAGDGVGTIWEIVVHASGWLEDTLGDLTGSPSQENTDWPPVDDTSPAAWDRTKQNLRSSVTAFDSLQSGLSEEELFSVPPGTEDARILRIFDMVVHSSYHAGQIVKLKQLYEANVRQEQTALV